MGRAFVVAVTIVLTANDRASATIRGVVGSLSGVRGAAQASTRALSASAGALASIAKAGALLAGGALTIGLGGAAKAGLGFNDAMEQARASINAFTKDSAATEALLAKVEARAKATPFAFEDMATAAAALQPVMRATGNSFDDLISQAEILAASNPAEGLVGATFALKEAASGDFASIIERFNLSRTTLNRLKDEGVPAMEAVRIAMQEMGYDSELVSNMAETMRGRWSTTQDQFTSLASIMTQPIFDTVSEGLGSLNAALDANRPQLEGFATAMGERIGTAITWLTTTGVPMAMSAFQTLQTTFQDAAAFVTGTLVPGFQTAFQTITELIGGLASGDFSALQETLSGLFGSDIARQVTGILATVHSTFSEIVAFVTGTVIPAFQEAWPQIVAGAQAVLPLILEVVQGVTDGMAERWQAIVGAAEAVWPVVQEVIGSALAIIQGFLDEHGATIVSTLLGAWQQVNDLISSLIPPIASIVMTVFGAIGDFLAEHGPQIQAFLGDAWARISDIIQTAIQIISAIIIPAFQRIASFIAAHREEIVAFLSGAWDAISNLITAALTIIQGVLNAALQAMEGDWSGAWETITATMASAWENIKAAFSGALAALGAVLQTGMDALVSIVNGLGSRLYSAGASIIAMLRSGIESAWGNLTGWFSGKLQELRNMLPFSEPKDPSSPLYGLATAGAAIIHQIQAGIDSEDLDLNEENITIVDTLASVIDKIGTALSSITEGLGAIGGATLPGRDSIQGIVTFLRDTVADFWHGAQDVLYALETDIAPKLADQAGKAMGALGDALDFLNASEDEQRFVAPSRDLLQGLVTLLRDTLADFWHAAQEVLYALETDQAPKLADQASKALGALGDALDFLSDIDEEQRWRAPSRDRMQGLVAFLRDTVQLFFDEAQAVLVALETDYGPRLAEQASSALDALSDTLGLFTTIDDDQSWQAPSREAMHGIVVFLRDTIRLFWQEAQTVLAELETDIVPKFADVVESSIGALSDTFGFLADLHEAEWSTVPEQVFEALAGTIHQAVYWLEQIANTFADDGLKAIHDFSESGGEGIAMLRDTVELMTDLRDLEAVPAERFQLLFDSFMQAVSLIQRLADAAGPMLEQIEQWHDKTIAAVDLIKETIEAIGSIGEIPALPELPQAPSQPDASLASVPNNVRAVAASSPLTPYVTSINTILQALRGIPGGIDEGKAKVLDFVGKAIDIFESVRQFGHFRSFRAPDAATVNGIADATNTIMQAIGRIVQNVAAFNTKKIGDWAGTVKSLLDIASAGIAAISRFGENITVPSEDRLQVLSQAIRSIIQHFAALARTISIDLVNEARNFADAGGVVAAIVEPAVSAIVALTKNAASLIRPSNDQLWMLADTIGRLVIQFGTIAEYMDRDLFEEAQAFAASAGAVAGVVEPAIKGLVAFTKNIATLVTPTNDHLNALGTAVSLLVTTLGGIGRTLGEPVLTGAKQLAETVSAILNVISSVADGVTDLGKMPILPASALDRFAENIRLIARMLDRLTSDAGPQLTRAEQWRDTMQALAAAVAAGSSAMQTVRSTTALPAVPRGALASASGALATPIRGGDTYYITIPVDARGADAGVEQRIRALLPEIEARISAGIAKRTFDRAGGVGALERLGVR